MYLFDPNRPTELFHERQEALIGEARDARLARHEGSASPTGAERIPENPPSTSFCEPVFALAMRWMATWR
jgi:hypothetical protein